MYLQSKGFNFLMVSLNLIFKIEKVIAKVLYACGLDGHLSNRYVDNLIQSTEKLKDGFNLNPIEAEFCARILGYETISNAEKIDFLSALANKGETALEVSAFAKVFRSLAINPQLDDYAACGIDVCGTGGDGFGTFNISTTVAFVLAALGIPVLKHGNRSITSKCGSADLMEAIGIELMIDLHNHRKALEALNFTFFFAPSFHPVFKSIMPARKALAANGSKSIFNLLGPLINPAKPKFQLIGVYSKEWINPIAEALDNMNLDRGIVVHGVPLEGTALDELSCAGHNFHRGFGKLSGIDGVLEIQSTGLQRCDAEELKGGTVEDNTKILFAFASNEESTVPRGLRDTIYLNTAAALLSCGRVQTLSEGVLQARSCIESGKLINWINKVRDFYKSIARQS